MFFSRTARPVSRHHPIRTRRTVTQKRRLNIHEYQSHNVMREYGVSVGKGFVAHNIQDVQKLIDTEFANDNDIVLKAQILAGGRGKGYFDSGLDGGVHICNSKEQVLDYAKQMLGHNLITKQTDEKGRPVNAVYLCERRFISSEKYLALMLDRDNDGVILIGSAKGGVNIEEVAETDPDAIVRLPINLNEGLSAKDATFVAERLGFEGDRVAKATAQIERLYKLFVEKDATMVEVNPFVETDDGEVLCLDAKLNFDSNAMYRHKDLLAMRDPTQEDPREVAASEFDLNYIGLDGSIACLVNGAGLAMATMDIIKLYGGEPANFLDIGGGASEQQVTEAMKILTSDKRVKAILVNIFGGIMKCDVIAQGLINAAKQLDLQVPVVVRLQGTNFKEAKEIIDKSGLKLISADNLDEAAQEAVRAAEV